MNKIIIKQRWRMGGELKAAAVRRGAKEANLRQAVSLLAVPSNATAHLHPSENSYFLTNNSWCLLRHFSVKKKTKE